MKVLITGISGFAGVHLLDRLLDEGHEVSGISRSGESPELDRRRQRWGSRFTVSALDVSDTASLVSLFRKLRPDRIVHLAGLSFAPEAREDQMLRPASPYGLGKAAADLAGFQMYWRDGLDVVRVRPFNHTGPGQAPIFVCSELARKLVAARRGLGPKVIRTGNLDVDRDFSDVRDVVCAYARLLRLGTAGEVYNVASGRTVSVREVLDLLIGITGAEVTIETELARVRTNEIPRIEVSIERIAAEAGWRPGIQLEQTLCDVVAYWEGELAS